MLKRVQDSEQQEIGKSLQMNSHTHKRHDKSIQKEPFRLEISM